MAKGAAHTDKPRLGRFALGSRVFVGEVTGGQVRELTARTMTEAIVSGFEVTETSHKLASVRVLVPIERPSKIVCVGLNYKSHIREMRQLEPKTPLLFSKPSSAIIGPGESIVVPRASARVDFEGESAIVIGRRARHTERPEEHIFGYTCINDVTARDLQKLDPDWTRAKGFDTFAPVGPYISIETPSRVTTKLNGKVVQDSPLSDRVFGDLDLVRYISTVMTLEPGDIIATGTPSGIAPMKAGDVVEVEVDTVGRLRNQVVGTQ
jgi:2-keto-4-pentenoate hydratase/2-oxohepta-3-ene-1,7-dioic acid hydratase in catechol pathway